MSTTLQALQLYSRCRLGHYNGCVKFEFNDRSLHTDIDSERRGFVRAILGTKSIFYDIITMKVIYLTITVGRSN